MLNSDIVYFKPIESTDLEKRVEWINDPEVQATLNFDYPTSLARTEKWFDNAVIDITRRDFSIFNTEDSAYIGFCGLLNIKVPVMKAELYMIIGDQNYWGKGYGTESYRLLVNFGFQELGLNKIYGYQLTHNKAALKAVEKLDWKQEGLLRQEIFSHGKISDCYLVSVLRDEWKDNKKYII